MCPCGGIGRRGGPGIPWYSLTRNRASSSLAMGTLKSSKSLRNNSFLKKKSHLATALLRALASRRSLAPCDSAKSATAPCHPSGGFR